MDAANAANAANDIPSKMLSLENKITDISNDIKLLTSQNQNLQKLNKELSTYLDELYERVYENEVKFNDLCQYSRRENVELHNIPEAITQRNLEQYVLEVLASLRINCSSYDLVAVHRTGKRIPGKHRIVLVRFMNRKNAYSCIKYSKELKKSAPYRSIFITENLCPAHRNIFNKLYKLKKTGKIFDVWMYNGAVFFRYTDKDDSTLIQHIDDIDYYIDEKSAAVVIVEIDDDP